MSKGERGQRKVANAEKEDLRVSSALFSPSESDS